jgi:hypothetical protein
MKTNTTKSKYVKPSITAVEWDFNESVCQVTLASPGISITDTTYKTRIEHFQVSGEKFLDDKWTTWREGSR